MIEILFEFGADIILVRIKSKSDITFCNTQFGAAEAPIDNLQLSQGGCIKEFPDLRDNPEWRKIAIARWKKHMLEMKDGTEVGEYIIKELQKVGYKPKKIMKNGFRPQNLSGVYK